MCKKQHECECYENKSIFGQGGDCCCSFPTLIILILIILQFNKGRRRHEECECECECEEENREDRPLIDNSILFIIALFFLACCNPCRRY